MLAISEAELDALTRDLDDAHHDALPSMRESLAEWRDSRRRRPRRHHPTWCRPRRAGGRSSSVAARCSAVSRSSGSGAGSGLAGRRHPGRGAAVPGGGRRQKLTGDLAVVALAASLENLAVATYQAGIDAATAGKLGAVPPAVVTFAHDRAEPAQGPRRGVERRAHRRGQEGGHRRRPHGEEVVDTAFAQVKDVPGLAKLALDLENVRGGDVPRGDRRGEEPGRHQDRGDASSRSRCSTPRS